MSEEQPEALDVRVETKYDPGQGICSVDFGVEGFAMVHVRWNENGLAVAAELLAAGPQILEQIQAQLAELMEQAKADAEEETDG